MAGNNIAQEIITRAEQAKNQNPSSLDSLRPRAEPQVLDGNLVSTENGIPRYQADLPKSNSIEVATEPEGSGLNKGLKQYLDSLDGSRNDDKQLAALYTDEFKKAKLKVRERDKWASDFEITEEVQRSRPEVSEARERQANEALKALLPSMQQNLLRMIDNGSFSDALSAEDRGKTGYPRDREVYSEISSSLSKLLSFEPLTDNETSQDREKRIVLALSFIQSIIMPGGYTLYMYAFDEHVGRAKDVQVNSGQEHFHHSDEYGQIMNNAGALYQAIRAKYPGMGGSRDPEVYARAMEGGKWAEIDIKRYNLLGGWYNAQQDTPSNAASQAKT
jgi:hypothetical protein